MTERVGRAGRLRLLTAVLFAAAVATSVARRVPDVVDRPLSALAGVPVPVPLPYASTQGNESVRDLALTVEDIPAIERFDEIRLFIGTFGTTPTLRYGWLQIAGRSCSYHATHARLVENAPVSFRRQGDCGTAGATRSTGTLRLAFEGPARYARAAVWTTTPADGAVPRLSVKPFEQTLGLAGRGIDYRPGPAIPRATLLAFMWDVRPWQLWALLLGALALVIAGAAVMIATRPYGAVLASFAIAAGLALSYAITVPPLQAPDEPDHLLSFAKLTGRSALHEAVSSWARRIHFDRMTFLPNERFTPADREQPFDRDWPPLEVFAENVRLRSSTATRLWQLVASVVPPNPAHALLLFRFVQSLLFAAAFAAGAAFLSGSGLITCASILPLVVLTLPTLPFFGMHHSEITFTLAAFVLAGYAAFALAMNVSSRWCGPMLGLALALVAAGPRNGWPVLPTVAALAASRLATRAAVETPRADTIRFWGGLAAPAVILFASGLLWIPSPFYEQWRLTEFDPRAGLSSGSFLAGLLAGALVGGLLERFARSMPFLSRGVGSIARVLSVLTGITIVATIATSIWIDLPVVPPVEATPPASALSYMRSVLAAVTTAVRVRGFDFLTWTSLWGGYGWANAILPQPAVAIVTVAGAFAAVATLSRAARQHHGAMATVVMLGLLGILVSIAATAVSSFGLQRNVHGRYLLGPCIIGLCLLAAPWWTRESRRGARTAVLFGLCCGLHAYAIGFLLEKYFG